MTAHEKHDTNTQTHPCTQSSSPALTIDIGTVIQHGLHAGAVAYVPEAHRGVPAAAGEQERQFAVPGDAADWCSVALQRAAAYAGRGVPHAQCSVKGRGVGCGRTDGRTEEEEELEGAAADGAACAVTNRTTRRQLFLYPSKAHRTSGHAALRGKFRGEGRGRLAGGDKELLRWFLARAHGENEAGKAEQREARRPRHVLSGRGELRAS